MPAKEKFFRDLKTVHVVFVLSAVALFGSTIWMMAEDHIDQWRDYQRVGYRIEATQLRRDKQAIQDDKFQQTKKELQAKKKSQKLNQEAIAEQKQTIAQLENAVDLADRKAREMKARQNVARADYDLAVSKGRTPETLARLKDKFEEYRKKAEAAQLSLQKKKAALDEAREKLDRLTAERDAIQKQLDKLTADVKRLDDALEKVDPESWLSAAKREMMEWPILDGFNSHLQIRQDWLPELDIKLGMAETDRFDRCRTCHVKIDRVEQGNVPAFPIGETLAVKGEPEAAPISQWFNKGKFPHPYATHPNPDLYVTARSPHPVPQFGCTICHQGQGSGTTFSNASHTPNNPHQHHQWAEKHEFAKNHYWEYPMRPERFEESSCLKCHHDVEELGVNPEFGATAPKVYKGYRLIKKYGCFGCHQINGYEQGKPIGPDLRLEPNTKEEKQKYAEDPSAVPGKLRKVGPSLRHIAAKTTEDWIAYWVEEPTRFRPSTTMPQFFDLTNQQDPHAQRMKPVELAGIAAYLTGQSEPIELMQPADGYQPNAERGKDLFAQKGCLACHSHTAFPELDADFGPNLTQIHAKVKPPKNGKTWTPESEGFRWLYTWIRNPKRYHPRTKMPHLFLEPYQKEGEQVDPAADIAAFLLQDGPKEYAPKDVPEEALNELTRLYLSKALTPDQVETTMTTHEYPIDRENIVGDEIELTTENSDAEVGDQQWQEMKLRYVGRRTISRYGCFGCHDIPGFKDARPIGTALQDWGRKDTSKLAFAHIEEFLHEHGEPHVGIQVAREETKNQTGVIVGEVTPSSGAAIAGLQPGDVIRQLGGQTVETFSDFNNRMRSFEAGAEVQTVVSRGGERLELSLPMRTSTRRRAEIALKRMRAGGYEEQHHEKREMSAAYFYDNILHHGRAGFIWQKLRAPRSYDYHKTETTDYDARLRMPRFPLKEEEIEAIATFVLGLVAEPPREEYIYHPEPRDRARIEGDRLLKKFNCSGCHMLDLPEIRYGTDPDDLLASQLSPADHPEGRDLLKELKPPQDGKTGETMQVETADGEQKTLPVIRFHGLPFSKPDPSMPAEFREYAFDLWETLKVNDKELLPGSRMLVPEKNLKTIEPARGGNFASWLVERLMKQKTDGNRSLAWQMAPPPLYKEGIKVQTPWLYRFLRDPKQLRYTTVLRMPRFNLDKPEARKLANYFAAVDGAPYPYQQVPQREPDYLAEKNRRLEGQLGQDAAYLDEAWKMLNAPLCIKCHALGGRPYQGDPEKDIRGPDLKYAADRLRPKWLALWLYKPQWLTPYTSMPAPLPRNQKQFEELFDGEAQTQTIAIRDALMNYHRLMEEEGKTVYKPKEASETTASTATTQD